MILVAFMEDLADVAVFERRCVENRREFSVHYDALFVFLQLLTEVLVSWNFVALLYFRYFRRMIRSFAILYRIFGPLKFDTILFIMIINVDR